MFKSTSKNWFNSSKASELSGLSTYMVDYLCRTDVIKPECLGRGIERQYSFGDVVMLRAVATLLSAGVSVSNLREGLAEASKEFPSITPSTLPGRYMVSDGKTLYFKSNKRDLLVQIGTGGQFTFAFVLELEKIRNQVTTEATKLGYLHVA